MWHNYELKMPDVRFNLKNKSETPTLISLIFRYNGQRLVYSTGQKIDPKFWNDQKQRVKETKQFSEYPEFNAFLNRLESETQTIYRRFLNNGVLPTMEDFKKELDTVTLRNAKESAEMSLFAFIEKVIVERATTHSKGTVKTYNTLLMRLRSYASERRVKVDFDTVDLEFYNDFIEYLYAPPLSMSVNFVGKLISNLKLFLNEAAERGLNDNLKFKSRRFKAFTQNVDNIYLDENELAHLYAFDFSAHPRIERVKDLFLVGCFTGLRFSDFSNLKPENIKTRTGGKGSQFEVIQLVTQKTGTPVEIPLHPYVKAIMSKYQGETVNSLPRSLTNQKMNKYLKEMGKMAGIDGTEMQVKTNGGRRYEVTVPKYELISTHTARRSFATNAFKAGVPSISIMRITGHSTEKAFMKYIKITNEDNARLLSNHRFFNPG